MFEADREAIISNKDLSDEEKEEQIANEVEVLYCQVAVPGAAQPFL